MIRKSNFSVPLLGLATVLVAAPLAAQEPMTVTGEHRQVYQERVSFADLDLRKWPAQQLLKSRVRRASSSLCFKAEGVIHDQPGINGGLSCDDQTYLDARPQIVAAIDKAKSGQPQVAMTFVISAARIR